MNKFFGSVLVTAGLLTLARSSQAQFLQLVSVQFGSSVATGSNNGSFTGAGVLLDSNFNSDTKSHTYFTAETTGVSDLHDSNFDPTTISETKTDGGTYHQGGQVTGFANPGDNALFNGSNCFGGQGYSLPVSLNLSGLSPLGVYNLYLYVSDPNGGANTLIQATLGSQSYYLDTISSASANSYVLGSATTAAAATQGNYFEFTGLIGSAAETINFTTGGMEFDGFQLEETAMVPEPSTVGLMSAGLISFAGLVLRRRKLASR